MVMRDEAANHLHELQDPVLVLPRETHENLRVLLHLFALISFLIVVTIVQLNEYSAKQPNDHHENHCQALFLRRHLVLKSIQSNHSIPIVNHRLTLSKRNIMEFPIITGEA